ncbi:hypothetical protein [Coralloluteibacterium stylophorae]|uniref:Uncharacterized protein n=1 Tax=Coralloluteibacterium stylophorae TaxID=1776034 RepID=A0AAP2CB57_9GAMM|nr:hypothetical protein [Coralloluteibacterium stylophorae]MBS7457174.1 hypothetical protein [Coralloluteibacterium stylophorae]
MNLTPRLRIFFATAILSLTAFSGAATELDYEKAILLDAEDLAEQGIAEAYARVLPELTKYVATPLVIQEHIDSHALSYEVSVGSRRYPIYPSSHGGDEYESWGVATAALFAIINEQLEDSAVGFYAVNSGNDLMGMFLTPAEAERAQRALPRKTEWPYMPANCPPWFGQRH